MTADIEERDWNRAKLAAMDRVRCDHTLSASLRAVGGELFSLCDYRTGDAYPSEAYLVGKLGLSPRTVKMAVKALQEAGYFEVVKSGRCNRYRPRFTEQVQNLHLSRPQHVQDLHLSEDDRCKIRPEQVQKTSSNRCKKRPPISLENSLRASAQAREATSPVGAPDGADGSPLPGLGPASALLRQRIGAVKFQAWFADVAVIVAANGQLTLAAATAFKRDYLIQHFSADVIAAWCALGEPIVRLEVVVRAAGSAPALLPEKVPGARWLLDAGRAIVRERMLIADDKAQILIVGWLAQSRNDAAGLAAILAETDAQNFIGERFCSVVVQRIRALTPKDQRELPLMANVKRRAHG